MLRIGCRRLLTPCLVTLASLAFAPAPFYRPARSDSTEEEFRKLQGDWARESLTISGTEAPSLGGTAVIRGDRMTYPETKDVFVLTLDVKASPRRMYSERISPRGEAQYR